LELEWFAEQYRNAAVKRWGLINLSFERPFDGEHSAHIHWLASPVERFQSSPQSPSQ